MDARPVLGLPAVPATFLDDVSTTQASRRRQRGAQARRRGPGRRGTASHGGATGDVGVAFKFLMVAYVLDDDVDDDPDEDDDVDEDDGDSNDEDEDEDEDVETWQVFEQMPFR